VGMKFVRDNNEEGEYGQLWSFHEKVDEVVVID